MEVRFWHKDCTPRRPLRTCRLSSVGKSAGLKPQRSQGRVLETAPVCIPARFADALEAQLDELRPTKPAVVGSNPSKRTNFPGLSATTARSPGLYDRIAQQDRARSSDGRGWLGSNPPAIATITLVVGILVRPLGKGRAIRPLPDWNGKGSNERPYILGPGAASAESLASRMCR